MKGQMSGRGPVIVLVVVAALVGACASASEVEDGITEEAKEDFDLEITVDCPGDIDGSSAGDTFDCTASAEGTNEVTVPVTITDESFEWSNEDIAPLAYSELEEDLGEAVQDNLDESDIANPPPLELSGPCIIILGSGNKLCGDDAEAYCNAVPSSALEPESMTVCQDVLSGRAGSVAP